MIAFGAGAAILSAAMALWSNREHQPTGGAWSWRGFGRLRRRMDDRSLSLHLPALLEELARSMRSGMSVRSALIEVGPTIEGALGVDLLQVTERLRAGATLDQALERWATQRPQVRGVALTTAAVSMAGNAGASVAQAVDGVADSLREELGLHAEVRALASQAQASAVLIAVLPVVFAFVAAAADPQTLGFMVNSGLGRVCLSVGLALDLLGFLWMRKITSAIS